MKKNVHLVVIDAQNDFVDVPEALQPKVWDTTQKPALAVPGAHQDMIRLAQFIREAGGHLSGITTTQDTHQAVGIERITFWTDTEGAFVAPFTEITLDDVVSGRYTPNHAPARVKEVLSKLEGAGKKLCVWPVHCVAETWGHEIHADVAAALMGWETKHGLQVNKAFKGHYGLTEHYGVFEAEVPFENIPSTLFNYSLAKQVTAGVDMLVVAGQAASHCVAASVEQLLRFKRSQANTKFPQIVLLSECMSPVPGFESLANQFYDRAAAAGVVRMTSREACAAMFA